MTLQAAMPEIELKYARKVDVWVSDMFLQHDLSPVRNTLQRTATRCNALQHAATHCNMLRYIARPEIRAKSGGLGMFLQHDLSPVRITLQHTATR